MIIFSRKTRGCWVPPFLETPTCLYNASFFIGKVALFWKIEARRTKRSWRCIYTWNPNDLYFWRSTPQNKAFSNQNKGQPGPRYLYTRLNYYIVFTSTNPGCQSPLWIHYYKLTVTVLGVDLRDYIIPYNYRSGWWYEINKDWSSWILSQSTGMKPSKYSTSLDIGMKLKPNGKKNI